MFLRYTHFGIGHPPQLRKIARDCLTTTTAASVNDSDMDVDEHSEINCGDGQEEWDEGFSSDDTDVDADSGLEDEAEEGSDEEGDLYDLPSF
jgi:hypothetical protein